MLVSVKLNLPKYLVEAFEKEGDLEAVLESRLIAAANYTSKKPLYIDDSTRQQFDSLFGKNFSTPEELLAAVKKLMTVKVEKVNIALNPTLITRLRTRCFGLPFEDFLVKQVVGGLEEYVGMR
jgi:hypothetical protein